MNKILFFTPFILLLFSCESDLPDSNRLSISHFFNAEEILVGNNKGVLLKSYDSGFSWKEVFNEPSFSFNDIKFLNDTIGIISSEEGKFYSTFDQGESWNKLELSINEKSSISISNNIFFVYSENGRLILSRDTLKSWQELVTPQNVDIRSAYIDDRNYIWLSTIDRSSRIGTVFFTRDDGEYWFPSIEMENEMYFITGSGSTLVAGGEDKIIYSSNRGDSWNIRWELETIQQDSITNFSSKVSFINEFERNGSTLVAGGLYFGIEPAVLVSIDNGLNWYDAYPESRVSFGGRIKSISLINQLEIGISGTAFTALKTENAGSTWQIVDLNGIKD